MERLLNLKERKRKDICSSIWLASLIDWGSGEIQEQPACGSCGISGFFLWTPTSSKICIPTNVTEPVESERESSSIFKLLKKELSSFNFSIIFGHAEK